LKIPNETKTKDCPHQNECADESKRFRRYESSANRQNSDQKNRQIDNECAGKGK